MNLETSKPANKIFSIFPLLDSLRNYSKEDFTGDLTAGLTIAVLLIPQGMAYAMIAGLPPVAGLYASIVPVAIYAIMGTSRQLSVGPVAIISLLVASSLAELNLTGDEYMVYAIVLALLSGLLLLLMGLFRIGFLDNFLSHSMISGYTSAAAIIIGMSQLKHLTGLKLQDHHIVFVTLYETIKQFNEINWITFITGIISIGIIYLLKNINKKIPGALIAIVLGMLTVYYGGLSASISVIGDVPKGFPPFRIQELDFKIISDLFIVALIIGVVGFMESISVAKAIATRTRHNIDANKELIGLGLANIGGSFFSAYPVTGGFSRTAVNYEAGARTGMASIITAVFIAITVVFFTPYLYYIPKVCLAAVIMVAVIGLIDIKGANHTFKVNRKDGYVLVITFLTTLLIGVEQGILVGVITSLALFIWRTARPHVAVLGKMPESDEIYRNVERFPEAVTWPHIGILRVDASLYFANVRFLENKVIQLLSEKKEMKYFILDGSGINDIDASGEETLRGIVSNLKIQGCKFYIASLKGPVRDVLTNAGFYNFLGQDYFFDTISQAVKKINGV
ncbi:MAG TPA: sulfate permease [Candidatus Eremiobacteraeota bacterium]|nr:MAG: putative sulfate transporter [bacterium ADurb.Bin363]HPZ09352.1 sulfate permease [Candidatus Eremiobacteraeota bacterium]